MSNSRHIWEGWTVQDFINELTPIFEIQQSNSFGFGTSTFESKEDIKEWCKDNQPYYKKHIPEVANHFIKKAGL
jgi:hypothetical protein